MIEIERDSLERYLRETLGESVRLIGVGEIGALDEQAMKEFGLVDHSVWFEFGPSPGRSSIRGGESWGSEK